METTNKNIPRDVFMHLLSLIALAMSAINFGVLLFALINSYVADVIADRYGWAGAYFSQMRWSVAALVVVFPVLYWTQRFLRIDIQANPEKRSLWIRRWLLYFTLFVSAVVIIGDLVALIFNFLEGELSLRFLLKILVILAISGSIFAYYKNQLKEIPNRMKLFVNVIVAFVLVAVVAGLWTAGLPQNRRLARIDTERVNDLQNIQSNITNYWQINQKLPVSLKDMENIASGFIIPTDPVTKQQYEYVAIEKLKFKLCATFDAASDTSGADQPIQYIESGPGEFWTHQKGHACFERTINPEVYPQNGNLQKPLPVR